MIFQAAVFFQYKSSSTDKTTLIVISVIIGTVLLPIIGFLFFVCGVGAFHLFLVCIGKSTIEFLNEKKKIKTNAFIENDWCRSTPSLINFNYMINEATGYALNGYFLKPRENIEEIFGYKTIDTNDNNIIEAKQHTKITPIDQTFTERKQILKSEENKDAMSGHKKMITNNNSIIEAKQSMKTISNNI